MYHTKTRKNCAPDPEKNANNLIVACIEQGVVLYSTPATKIVPVPQLLLLLLHSSGGILLKGSIGNLKAAYGADSDIQDDQAQE
jgi:hypothetical protein